MLTCCIASRGRERQWRRELPPSPGPVADEKKDDEDRKHGAHAGPQHAYPPPGPPLPLRLGPFPPFHTRADVLQPLVQLPHPDPPLLQPCFERANAGRLGAERSVNARNLGAEGLGKRGGRVGEVLVVLAGGGAKTREGGGQGGENGDVFQQRVVCVVEAAGHGGGERGEGL